MKNTLTVLLAIVIISLLPLNAYANGNTEHIFSFEGITVEFSDTSSFTIEEQAKIAEFVVNGTNDSSASTYNLWCTMFGHNTTTESFSVIEHCVRNDQPRCLKTIQEVTACSRCDYVSTNVLNTSYIMCCE